mmetsp:Transcript_96339/g.215798  ORF Transcript_96339/g.215798 Transcript_96339/m.215798 type:complete len:229 (-) Transcript_96339:151-837(-)
MTLPPGDVAKRTVRERRQASLLPGSASCVVSSGWVFSASDGWASGVGGWLGTAVADHAASSCSGSSASATSTPAHSSVSPSAAMDASSSKPHMASNGSSAEASTSRPKVRVTSNGSCSMASGSGEQAAGAAASSADRALLGVPGVSSATGGADIPDTTEARRCSMKPVASDSARANRRSFSCSRSNCTSSSVETRAPCRRRRTCNSRTSSTTFGHLSCSDSASSLSFV